MENESKLRRSLEFLIFFFLILVHGSMFCQIVDYQLEVDKGKLTAVANLKSSFSNSLRRLIYLYQLQVDNQLVV